MMTCRVENVIFEDVCCHLISCIGGNRNVSFMYEVFRFLESMHSKSTVPFHDIATNDSWFVNMLDRNKCSSMISEHFKIKI